MWADSSRITPRAPIDDEVPLDAMAGDEFNAAAESDVAFQQSGDQAVLSLVAAFDKL